VVLTGCFTAPEKVGAAPKADYMEGMAVFVMADRGMRVEAASKA
jgi:hypothetical protein